MFCIVSLRCSSEGPSLRRDPAKAVGRLPQLPPLRQLAPKAPGGAGSRAPRGNTAGSRGGCWWKPNGLRGSVSRRDWCLGKRENGDAQQIHRPRRQQRTDRPLNPQHAARRQRTPFSCRPASWSRRKVRHSGWERVPYRVLGHGMERLRLQWPWRSRSVVARAVKVIAAASTTRSGRVIGAGSPD